MFEDPISNNKENRNIAPRPWDAPGILFFLISLVNMELLMFKFDSLISNNKENKKIIRDIKHNASWS